MPGSSPRSAVTSSPLIDAATFLGSAATLIASRSRSPQSLRREQHFLRELSAGLSHIARTRVLRELTIGVCAALVVIGFAETLVFAIVTNGLHRSPAFVGVLETFQGVGAIGGGLTAALLMRRLGDVRLAGLGLSLFGAACFGLLIPSLGAVLPSGVVIGVGIAWAIVALATAYQRRSPQHVQGRVAAASNMLFSVPQTASIAAGAALITLIDYRIEIVIMAVVTLIASAYLFTRRAEEIVESEGVLAEAA